MKPQPAIIPAITAITAIAVLSAVATAVLFSGCTVGPNYTPPAATDLAPGDWSDTSSPEPEIDLHAWWHQLNDPELTALVEHAFEGNLTLAQTRERVIVSRARRGIANADRVPNLDAAGSYVRNEIGDDGFILGGVPQGVGIDTYSTGVVAGWELDLWGRVGRLVEAADAEIGFAIEDVRASRVALAAEVAREVILIRTLDLETALVEATTAADRDALEIASARAQAGFGDALDVARAQRVLDANAALVPALAADRRAAEFRLAILLGLVPGQVQVQGSGAALPSRAVIPHRGVPADLLMRRPDLRRAERELAAATARIGSEQAAWYPRVTLSGSLTLQGPDAGDVVNPDAYILQAGPSISLPIFEGGRIRSRVLQAESVQRQALLRLRSAVLSALSEVETASVRRARTEDRVSRLETAEAAARDAEDLAFDRYTAGTVDFLDVTEARRARLSIESERVAAERDATLRLVDLYAALGGGWTTDDASVAFTQ